MNRTLWTSWTFNGLWNVLPGHLPGQNPDIALPTATRSPPRCASSGRRSARARSGTGAALEVPAGSPTDAGLLGLGFDRWREAKYVFPLRRYGRREPGNGDHAPPSIRALTARHLDYGIQKVLTPLSRHRGPPERRLYRRRPYSTSAQTCAEVRSVRAPDHRLRHLTLDRAPRAESGRTYGRSAPVPGLHTPGTAHFRFRKLSATDRSGKNGPKPTAAVARTWRQLERPETSAANRSQTSAVATDPYPPEVSDRGDSQRPRLCVRRTKRANRRTL
jgi:hypothetical protein